MTSRIACADFSFPLLSHDHALDLISMLDLGGVDIALFQDRSHLQPAGEFQNVNQSAERLAKKVADRGLKIADLYLQMSLDFRTHAINQPAAARRRKARDWFLRTLDYSARCGAKHVTILPGVRYPDEPAGQSWGRCCDELSWRVEKAGDCKIEFSVEPHIGSIVTRPKKVLKLIEDVPGLKLTLDYSHFVRQGIPQHEVEPLIEFASHFHIRGARPGRIQVPFTQSTIDFQRVCKVAKKHGYRGWFELEYCYADWEKCNECDALAESIQYRDFLRSLKMGL